MVPRPMIALLVAASLLVSCRSGGGSPTSQLRPATVGDRNSVEPELQRTVKHVIYLHVYADQAHVREVPNWQAKFRATVLRANRLLARVLDLQLEIASMTPWTRQSKSDDRNAILTELAGLQPGRPMVFVVGLLPSLPSATGRYDELGAAVHGGRHLFVRNAGDADEQRALDQGWDSVSRNKRDAIYIERKQHRELVVLLHELGHALGADHTDDHASIMHEGYDTAQQGYTADSVVRMRDQLADEADGGRATAAERAHAKRQDASHEAQRAINEARRAKDPDDARAHLQVAESHLAAFPGELADSWNAIARAYQQLGSITLSARAIAQAGADGDAAVLAWIGKMRARFAIPPDAVNDGLTPANESTYVELYTGALSAIAAGDFAAAKSKIDDGIAQIGDLPGFAVLACDLALRQNQTKRARAQCNRALARFDGASWGHFLSALLDQRAGKKASAVAHLERALALDPELAPARAQLDALRK